MKIQSTKAAEDIIPALVSRSKLWLKPTDQMDTWLDSLGFYRKHIARDASSLFRCVSEKIFLTQVYHLTVRKHCIQFALNNQDTFKRLTSVPVQDYVDRLYNQREWGNKLDMEIMSLLYHVDFIMYKEIKKPVEEYTLNNFGSYIVLSLSYEHHYDSVYSKQHIMNAAICQSIFYEVLYKCVFKLEEVDYAVGRMLHDKTARYNSELNVAFFSTGFQMRLEMRDNCRNVKDLLNCGITPFPYKVAKSLDPNIYRNVEYDTWNEQRKGLRHGLIMWNNRELQVGSRCIINFSEKNCVIKRHGYIQQMLPEKGPVLVFVEELGQKLTVPFESLEVLPSINAKQSEENIDFHVEDSVNEPSSSNNTVEATSETNVCPKIKEDNKISNRAPELCNVHYVHPTSLSIPSSCYACVTSQTNIAEQSSSLKMAPVSSHSNSMESTAKNAYDASSNDVAINNQIPYQVPTHPVMPQDALIQQTSASNLAPAKQTNSGECIDGSSVRVLYNHAVDPYYRYGYSNYPYYVVAPNFVYSSNAEHSVQQNTDVQRINYSPTSYSYGALPNELFYAMPVSNIPNKVEVPMYSTQILYSPYVKKTPRNVLGTPDCTNSESHYRQKDTLCIKDSVPLAPSVLPSIPQSSYPTSYPPLYYHSYDYCGTCPEMQSYEGMTSVYPAPQFVPLTYSDDMYQANGPVICQPLLPSHSQ